jgi:DNA mismatch repair protein MutS2
MIETTPPGALVLIDELATATDPDEGTALARAVLETLMARRVLTVVTTHYTALKAWAAEAAPGGGPPDRMSAGMGYDVDALTRRIGSPAAPA